MSDLGLSQGISAMCPLSCGELKERQRGEEDRKKRERERDSTWHVLYDQRVDTLRHLIDVCVCIGCMGHACIFLELKLSDVCWGRATTEGVMANLAPRQF